MEQGSYMLIKCGMTIRGTDGDIGTISEVIADESVDIFRGLVLTHGLLLHKQLFVSAEHVVGVADNTVQVNLSKEEAAHLPPPQTTHSSDTNA